MVYTHALRACPFGDKGSSPFPAIAAWSSGQACRAHNPEDVGSNPTVAIRIGHLHWLGVGLPNRICSFDSSPVHCNVSTRYLTIEVFCGSLQVVWNLRAKQSFGSSILLYRI